MLCLGGWGGGSGGGGLAERFEHKDVRQWGSRGEIGGGGEETVGCIVTRWPHS